MKFSLPMKVVTHIATESSQKGSIEDHFYQEETPLLHYAYRLVRRKEVAEELVQEAFLRAHQHWSSVENPKPWLYRAVRNLALNYLRKHKRESLSDEEANTAFEELPDKQANQLETASKLRHLMGELEEVDRELIRLKYEENLSYAVIAEKLNISIGNVGYRLHHLLKSLAVSLKSAGVEGSEG
ncbi:RNA polymerase sigma factor [Rubritalea sp.]|uniref:RNA polymerase sigma factor n=1 Tax=Rubritalea sp. TaxID=2109375 RepID=UPI003EF21460